MIRNKQMTTMDIKELLNRTDRFAANAGCNVCQGGALFTLADLAIAAWMNYNGQLTFGINNSIMFVSSAREGDVLRAEAVGICDHHKIPAVEVRVTNQDGRLICHVTGMGYRKNTKVPTEE